MPRESEIISRIRSRSGSTAGPPWGAGDDAAVFRPAPGVDSLVCCDLMVEGVHFRLEWAPPGLIGRKSLAVTLSDIAAMGGLPRFALISLALPDSASAESAGELLDGIFESAESAGVAVVGGDTSGSPGPLMIDTIAIGECPRGRAVTRGGAGDGEIIFVTGSLGSSSLGLALLERGRRLSDAGADAGREAELRRSALMKHLSPEPRLRFGRAIGEAGIATAMIDVSDGLSTDLSHVLEESGRGAVIFAEKIPVSEPALELAAEIEREPLELALHGGEEYELLFTVRPEDTEPLVDLAERLRTPVTPIGRITAGPGLVLERAGRTEHLAPSGYEHGV